MQAGSENAVKVHAMVRKEAVILRRHDGIDDGLGQILIAHQPPLAAGIIKQRGDNFRLEVVARKRPVTRKRGNGSNVAIRKIQRRIALLEFIALKE